MFTSISVRHTPAVGRGKIKTRTMAVGDWKSLSERQAYDLLQEIAVELDLPIHGPQATRRSFASAVGGS